MKSRGWNTEAVHTARACAGPARRVCHLALLVGLCVSGCGPPVVNLYEPRWVPNPVPTTYNDRDYATVLRENVREGGLVDYDHLKAHPDPLMRHLGLLAVVGPESTPGLFVTRSDRLAYYLNAYNASVLRFVLVRSIPETLHDVRLTPFERNHRIRIDGKLRSLADLRALARGQSNKDARIEFCLCSAAMGSPPLHDQPFRPDTLSRAVRRLAEQAMDNPDIVRINHENQRLLVARAIYLNRKAFFEFYARRTGGGSGSLLNALLYMAGGTRHEWLNTGVGYDIGVIPFDRALNKWAPSGSAG